MPSNLLSKFFRKKHSLPQGTFLKRALFQQPEPSFLSFLMQKNKQVEFTLSIYKRFPYTRYKVISTSQYTLVQGHRRILVIIQTLYIYFSIHQYTFPYTLCIRVHYTSLYMPFHAVLVSCEVTWVSLPTCQTTSKPFPYIHNSCVETMTMAINKGHQSRTKHD